MSRIKKKTKDLISRKAVVTALHKLRPDECDIGEGYYDGKDDALDDAIKAIKQLPSEGG
jgi:hypothetical protein